METPNSENKTNCWNLDQSTCDACSVMLAMVFGFAGLIYLCSGDWTGALIWLCLGASCALALGIPWVWSENLKTPRGLASLACCAFAIALLICTAPHHKKLHADATPKPAAAASGAK